ncbi:cellulose binding domain-containing protein [Fibrella aquatilis]|uniref:Lamin tail domain-containing protein n=1 Tax=Fibrella aquatilis TaxID=2817059 RepID=A0A939G9A6_9BACT|nr:cellulose binding domain-containing protein [Fibrella aquatilis]MBO0932999.1 lamin tail domain-containing protein [Fibrella aquatilis]
MTSSLQRAFYAWLGLFMLCMMPTRVRAQAPTDLFFSEYIEGSSNNKALELYNGTGSAINLATGQYIIQMYFNGGITASTTINLTGTIAPGGTYVVAPTSANATILTKANQTSGSAFYNGNDAIVLRKGGAAGTIVDAIGQVGFDPGTEWGTGLASTADNTLRRKASSCTGDVNASDAFVPSVEWDGFAIDTFDGLGTHSTNCGGTPTLPSVSIVATDANGAETGSDPIVFTVSRSGGTTAALTVNYTVGGTATNGTDYTPALSGVATIPVGQSSVTLTLAPVDDAVVDANETIILTITANAAYTIGSATATGTITDNEVTPGQRIHDIQGAAHISPLLGQTVNNVPGVVTGLRTNGFYMQDPTPDTDDRTSEGIFVFTSTAPTVAVGTSVLVSGTVAEFRSGGSAGTNNLTVTQIQTPTVATLSTGNALPPATLLGNGGRTIPNTIIEDQTGNVETGGLTFDPATDGIDFYESLEAMLVQINNPLAVSPTTQSGAAAGELWVVADNGANATIKSARGGVIVSANDFNPERIQLDDTVLNPPSGGFLTPSVNVGAQLSTATGIVNWTAGNYEVLLTSVPTVISNGLTKEVTALGATASQLTVSTFNVENLAPSDPSSKFTNLANRIVTNLKAPDILLLEEIQDNNGATNDAVVDANVTFGLLINAITSAGGPTYQYRQINPVDDQDGGQPGGNIRVGFLFNPARVSFVDRPGGTSTAATTVNNVNGTPQLSFNPGRVDPTNPAFANNDGSGPASNSRKPLAGEFLFNGQKVFIVGNHFSSKIPDDILFGVNQPATLFSEAQRRDQATVVRNFVQSVLAIDPNANVVVLGDLNDFEFSAPVNILKGAPLNALIETLPANERYTYVFEGNSQTIDHILVSNALRSKLDQYDVVHINAEFTNPDSDHDPSVARFTLATSLSLTAYATPAQLLTTGTTTLSATVSGGTGPYSYTFVGPGTITPNGNTATVSGIPAGVQTFTIIAGDATTPRSQTISTTVSVTVTAIQLHVLHRDVDNYADNNSVQPVLILQNQGSEALTLSALTLRYYLTVENFVPLSNLFTFYAQIGASNVKLRYVPLDAPRQGAFGYVEYSFTPEAGQLAANADSGPIQSYFAKSDYSGLYEPDDYSYNPVRDQLLANPRITAYYNGILVWGQEPALVTPLRQLRVLTESKNGPSATAITTNLILRNEGNLPVNYADLRIRYYFTADNQQGLTFYSNFMYEGALQGQLVSLNPPLANADTYLEIRPTFTGQLMPSSQLGTLWYSIYSPQGARFDQTNDYSYQEQPAEFSPNNRVVVYVGNERVWGQEPGASGRRASAEPGSELDVTVLGNPVRGDAVSVQIKGAGGQPLRLQLVSAQGKVITQQQIATPQAVEQHTLSLAGQGPGIVLLQVSTPTQTRTLRVLKAE